MPLALRDPSLLKNLCLIDGQWLAADDGSRIDVHNPATGEAVGHVPRMGEAETQRAIAAAERAFALWKQQTAEARARLLQRWFELMMENQEDLALIMTSEQGKPLAESRGEIAYAASYVQWFAEEARRIYGSTVPAPWADKRIIVTKEPVGVCAAITPWNFPAAMITRKVAPALAAGCTIIVKPAQQTPLSALAMAELAQRAGIPEGVFSVITGSSRAIGGVLTASMAVRKLTFTGSTEVGRVLAEQCAPTLKKMSLELGGNAPFIVFDDADLDAAVEGAMASKYRNTGQTCVCANRLLVQDGVYDAFMARLKVAVQALKVGNGLEAGVGQGPLIDQAAVDKVEELVADAVKNGAEVVLGGKRHALGGTFYEPTILANATDRMRIAREEVFGPVAPVFRFKTEEEAIRMANDTEYGLAAYFAVAPFGGVKQSGMGREGGAAGIEEYLSTKYLCMGH
ncbi:MAG: NAD-dependent succinate-semialdehyde dehydrogenase [Delftia acidovorans]|nr:NAD-dependent succinate-semialdehyde dehydrogenase [Delftia acidovorans]